MFDVLLDDVLHENDFLVMSNIGCGESWSFKDSHPNDEFSWIFSVESNEDITKHIDIDSRRNTSDAQKHGANDLFALHQQCVCHVDMIS